MTLSSNKNILFAAISVFVVASSMVNPCYGQRRRLHHYRMEERVRRTKSEGGKGISSDVSTVVDDASLALSNDPPSSMMKCQKYLEFQTDVLLGSNDDVDFCADYLVDPTSLAFASTDLCPNAIETNSICGDAFFCELSNDVPDTPTTCVNDAVRDIFCKSLFAGLPDNDEDDVGPGIAEQCTAACVAFVGQPDVGENCCSLSC